MHKTRIYAHSYVFKYIHGPDRLAASIHKYLEKNLGWCGLSGLLSNTVPTSLLMVRQLLKPCIHMYRLLYMKLLYTKPQCMFIKSFIIWTRCPWPSSLVWKIQFLVHSLNAQPKVGFNKFLGLLIIYNMQVSKDLCKFVYICVWILCNYVL